MVTLQCSSNIKYIDLHVALIPFTDNEEINKQNVYPV